MLIQPTSTQQLRAPADLRRRRRMPASLRLVHEPGVKATEGSGRISDRAAPAPAAFNQTKLAIAAVMQELDRPVSSIELQLIWAEHKALGIFEYHLSTLVMAKVVEVAYGPELHFKLTTRSEGPKLSLVRERCR